MLRQRPWIWASATPEKRKVGGSTPSLTTLGPSLTWGNADSGNGCSLRSSEGPDAVIRVAARHPRQRDQPAAGTFPLVIGSLWSDPAGRGQPPACRTDERPLMCALVGLWGSRTRTRGLNWSFARLARI